MPKYYEEKTSQYVIAEVYGERCEAWLDVEPPQTDRTGGYIRTLVGKTTLALDMSVHTKEHNKIECGSRIPFKVWVDGDWYKETILVTKNQKQLIFNEQNQPNAFYSVEGICCGPLELME